MGNILTLRQFETNIKEYYDEDTHNEIDIIKKKANKLIKKGHDCVSFLEPSQTKLLWCNAEPCAWKDLQ